MPADLHRRLLDELDPAAPWDADRDEAAYAALRAVIELHAPRPYFDHTPDWLICKGCDLDGYDAENPPWPCSTVRTIAEHLGIREGAEP